MSLERVSTRRLETGWKAKLEQAWRGVGGMDGNDDYGVSIEEGSVAG